MEWRRGLAWVLFLAGCTFSLAAPVVWMLQPEPPPPGPNGFHGDMGDEILYVAVSMLLLSGASVPIATGLAVADLPRAAVTIAVVLLLVAMLPAAGMLMTGIGPIMLVGGVFLAASAWGLMNAFQGPRVAPVDL